MNLTEWARAQGIAPRTAYRWFREGTLPVPAERVGPHTILMNIVLDDDEVEDDLVRDMIEVQTSFCARLYGRGSARSQARKALQAAATDG
ncbi:MAG: hypothetical protein ABIQ18_46745 [Umezawaea sp.]